MSFTKGLKKVAADPIVFSNIGKALHKGVKASGSSHVSEALRLKGIKHLGEAAKKAGGWSKAFTTQAGREHMAEGVGKAAPSLAVGGAYAAGAVKAYKKLAPKDDNQGYY
jgi:hypothetical protein